MKRKKGAYALTGRHLVRHENQHDNDVSNMLGWFHKHFKRVSSSPHEGEPEHRNPPSTSFARSPSPFPSALKPTTNPLQSALTSSMRWSRKYDVFVCHSSEDTDIEEAVRLVSFLESSPQSLRCFLSHRDACPGSAIATELCQAVQDSHCRALLITPNFLQDNWCKYIMHQALSEPMSSRNIPVIQNLAFSEYPLELKYIFYIDLNKNTNGYTLVSQSVLNYLEDQVEKEKALECNTTPPARE
ncbi:toll/interleukin-1 receptor domain-containing adapter protein [Genypterus blacodes]|uniref:toll/interleukin-1 receptor domain-containing adapter protein n=1 Tax=Genypterus blacodes TaxID=154954 RepID=UPI003F7734C2